MQTFLSHFEFVSHFHFKMQLFDFNLDAADMEGLYTLDINLPMRTYR